MRMRSFQVCECGAPLHVNERETPKPEGAQVLLKMLAAGVCHSDLHIWDGYYEIGGGKKLMLADRGIKLPLTMGHENVGEVVALGPEARAGGVGLMGVTLARKMGAKEVIVVDIDAGKREAASKAGANKTIDGGTADAVQQIQAATGGGAWAVIDFVGSSATVGLAVSSIIKGGTVVVVGLYGGDITVPTPYLPLRAMTLRGSYVGSQTDMAELLDLVKRTGMPPVPICTRPLDEVNATLNDLRAGKIVGRVVLTPAA